MPSLSSVWNLEPPASSPAAPPLSPYDIEKHPSSSSTSSYPSHRSSMSWGSGSSLHLGNLRGRGVVKRAGLVVGLLCLGVWAVSSVGSGGGAGGALLEVWGKGSSRGKVSQPWFRWGENSADEGEKGKRTRADELTRFPSSRRVPCLTDRIHVRSLPSRDRRLLGTSTSRRNDAGAAGRVAVESRRKGTGVRRREGDRDGRVLPVEHGAGK